MVVKSMRLNPGMCFYPKRLLRGKLSRNQDSQANQQNRRLDLSSQFQRSTLPRQQQRPSARLHFLHTAKLYAIFRVNCSIFGVCEALSNKNKFKQSVLINFTKIKHPSLEHVIKTATARWDYLKSDVFSPRLEC